MTFNDHHAGGDHFDVAANASANSRRVALALETRFELEDDMLNRARERLPVAV